MKPIPKTTALPAALSIVAAIALAWSLVMTANAAEEFTYNVFRKRLFRDESGQLKISRAGIAYRSDDGKTTIRMDLIDVLQVDLSDPKAIRLVSYDILKRRLSGRQTTTFLLREGKHGEALARFLASASNRPVIGAYSLDPKPQFEIPAYHRHRLGGCHGKIEVGPEGIRFVSDRPGDSRSWPYQDITTIGSMGAFHFRVRSMSETYNFDLKERLPEEAYRLAFQHVYRLTTTPAIG